MATRTLSLTEEARFLKLSPEALRRKAKTGEIPGAKAGKCWCFLEDDLVTFLRSRYAVTLAHGKRRGVAERRYPHITLQT